MRREPRVKARRESDDMQIRMIDTHCHLEQKEFRQDLNIVLQRAERMGIVCITSAIAPEEWEICLKTATHYENVFASIGLDPMLWQQTERLISFIEAHQEEIIAIGEVGLDYYRERDHSNRTAQIESLQRIVQLSKELQLPIQIHSRSAGKQALDVLSKTQASFVQMHAFDGKASYAREASRELDFYFSIPTSVVRSPQKQKLVKAVKIDRLLIETDSPVLGPDSEKRNDPTNLPIVINEVSRILRMDSEELREKVLENTIRLYPKISIR